jgi:hypothetical protein
MMVVVPIDQQMVNVEDLDFSGIHRWPATSIQESWPR